jgi:hypothetical protein
MPARRCSLCNEAWPTATDFNRCPRCDSETWWEGDATSPWTDSEARAIRNQTAVAAKLRDAAADPQHEHRVERYLHLGFSEVDAELLAVATETERDSTGRAWTRPLNWQRVARTLEAGCTHSAAVAIFT